MWFKKASISVLADKAQLEGLEDTLDQAKFLPVGSVGLKSYGWSEVRDGELCMKSNGSILLYFTIEKKVIPGSAVKVALAERCAGWEEQAGFAPGRKVRAELREQVMDELASRALTTRARTGVWIDTVAGRVVVDSSVVGTLDLIQRALIVTHGIELAHLPAWSGRDMTDWVTDEDTLPGDYTIDDAIVMEYPGERGTLVAFKKADLGTQAVMMHTAAGAQVTQLALTFDSKVSFMLQPIHQLRNIRPLDILKESQVERDADKLENDFVLMTGELRQLINSLVNDAMRKE